MLNIKDQNYFKRALNFFILSTILLLVTIPIALFFHPSEEFIKQLGSNSPESISKTQGLKKVWGFIQNNGFHVPIQMLLLALIPIPFFIYSKLNSIAYYSWNTIWFFHTF